MPTEQVTCDECGDSFPIDYGPETPVFNRGRDSTWATESCPNGHQVRYARYPKKDGIVIVGRDKVNWMR